MTMGADRAESQPDTGLEETLATAPATEPDWLGPADAAEVRAYEPPSAGRSAGVKLLGGLLLLLTFAWLGAIGYSIWLERPDPTLPNIMSWVTTLTGPLVLLALVWLLFGRTTRHETERFTRSVEAMRAESLALESVLAIVSTRIEENHARLRGEAEKLMSLGDEASDRLGRVTHYLSKETAALDGKSAALESAAAAAKVDIGVLLHDLPRAEEQARAVAEAMKEAGLAAHGQASALEAQLAALASRGREADEVLGGAAQRMGAHVARIESGSANAATSIGEASGNMTAAVDAAMARAAEAVDAAREGLEAQAAGMLAAIEHSRAALDRAGEDAARNLTERLDSISEKIHTLAGHLAAQDAASHALMAGLSHELADLDSSFERLAVTGTAQSEQLTASMAAVRESARALVSELDGGEAQAISLDGRAKLLSESLRQIAGQLGDELPAALALVEAQAGFSREAAEALAPVVHDVRTSAEAAAGRIGEAEASIGRQRDALETLLGRIDDGVRGADERLRGLGLAASEAHAEATKLVVNTGPELIDALVRVREAANQAAERAREAIASIIPESAAALGKAGRDALARAVSETVEQQLAELSTLSQRAIETARAASQRLTRQMLALGQTATAIEARIDDARREREEDESANFSRRVALLIESLNSTAIDVTKILSNEVTDSAWAAYLKGDRGVFTRRAVRLLDAAEAREIARHYDEEPEFREQVNRYIHDFESMLRRVLADRDGSPLGITILSSDMGKLYVALAQAIERLR
jgi:hypothetical protein